MSWNQGNYIIKGEEVKVKGKVRQKVVTTFIIDSTFDSIDRISTATTATHATRRCNTFSTWNVCDWCDLVIFLV
jgi:hypothetical protein